MTHLCVDHALTDSCEDTASVNPLDCTDPSCTNGLLKLLLESIDGRVSVLLLDGKADGLLR